MENKPNILTQVEELLKDRCIHYAIITMDHGKIAWTTSCLETAYGLLERMKFDIERTWEEEGQKEDWLGG